MSKFEQLAASVKVKLESRLGKENYIHTELDRITREWMSGKLTGKTNLGAAAIKTLDSEGDDALSNDLCKLDRMYKRKAGGYL